MADTRDHPLSILYVDDEPGLLAIGKIYLEKTGKFTVTTAEGPEEGITLLKEMPFDAIISDYQMPQCDGIAFLKYLRSRKDTTPFIIFTGKGREEVVIEALNEGADFYLQKGGDPKAQFAELANKVSYAVIRKKAEAALRESEERYRNVVETQSEFICRFIPDGTILFVNDAYCRRFNKAAEELIGSQFKPLIHRDDQKNVARLYASLTPESPVGINDQRTILPDNEIVWDRWSTRAFFDDYGKVREYQSVGRDITELIMRDRLLQEKNEELAASEEELRTQLEQIETIRDLLAQSNEYLENLITYANAPIIVWDRDLRITQFNDAFGRLTGIPPGQAIGSHIEMLFPEERREESMDLIQRAMDGEMWDVVEIPILNRTGDVRTVLWNSANIRSGEGEKIIATIAQGQDITDRKEAELALLQKNEELAGAEEELRTQLEEIISIRDILEETNEYLENLITYANAPIIVWDRDLRITQFNDAFGRLTGILPGQAIGSHIEMLFPEERREESMDLIQRAMDGEMWDVVEIPILNRTGDVRTVLWNSANIRSGEGETIIATIAQGQDITDRKDAENILKERIKELSCLYRISDAMEGSDRPYAEVMQAIAEIIPDGFKNPEITAASIWINEKEFSTPGYRLTPWSIQADILIFKEPVGSITICLMESNQILDEEEILIRTIADQIGRYSERIRTVARLHQANEQLTASEEELRERLEEIVAAQKQLALSEERYQAIFEHTNAASIIIEKDTRISLCNSAFEKLCGYSKDEVTGRNWTEFVSDSDREQMIAYHRQRRKEGEDVPRTYEFTFIDRAGMPHSTLVTAGMIPGTSQSVASIYDITDRKDAEVGLSQAHKKLRILSSITSHDIANKIMTIRGLLEIAQDSRDRPYPGMCHDEIQKAIDAIERQIVFMREYEQIGVQESGWMELAHLISRIDGNEVPVQNRCPEISFYADPMAEKVFQNLYMNTILHAKAARRIQITCEERGGALAIIWEDDGAGIPDNQKEEIFKRGFGKNTGFGLFLVREILGITGITIQETGTYGKGARFEVLVPAGGFRAA